MWTHRKMVWQFIIMYAHLHLLVLFKSQKTYREVASRYQTVADSCKTDMYMYIFCT